MILEPLFVNVNWLSKVKTNLNQDSGSLDGDKKSEKANILDNSLIDQGKQIVTNKIIDPMSNV